MRNYEKLSIEDFGEHLLRSGDLDPVYIALTEMVKRSLMDTHQLKRWLVAYWCFYNCGTASYLSRYIGRDFWGLARIAAQNTTPVQLKTEMRWPRGKERRHFRGEVSVKAIDTMSSMYEDPSEMVNFILGTPGEKLTMQIIAQRAKKHPLFGDWISFKIADMIDRVLKVPVNFDEAAVFMFTDPTKAALMLWREKQGMAPEAKPKDQAKVIHDVVDYLKKYFNSKGFMAQPFHDRPVDLQEVETVLCKWKSHRNGHYPLNNDIIEINEGMLDWVDYCATSKAFLECSPKVAA